MPRKPKPTARDKIELAIVYLDDGAPMSAARHLREAADEIEAAGKKFNDALERAIGKKIPRVRKAPADAQG